jgi:hypothetical protein
MAVSPILEINQLAPTQVDKVPAINDAIVQLEAALNSQLVVNLSAGPVALTFTQYSRHHVFVVTGQTMLQKLTVPLTTPTGLLPAYRVFLVQNQSGAYGVDVGGPSGGVVTIQPSSAAVLQSDGLNVISYGSGGPGPAGGALTIMTGFDPATTNADPGPGEIRLSSTTQNTSTALYMSVFDYNGTNWASVLDTLDASTSTVDGHIRLFNVANTAQWIMFELTARFAPTAGYRSFVVTPIGASTASPFTAGMVLGFAFTRAGDTGQPVLSTVNTWTARQHTPPVVLTDAATIAVNFALGNQFQVQLGGNRIMGNPSGCLAGDNGNISIQQDGAGSRLLTFASSWFPLGGAPGTLSTTPNSYDIVSYYAISPTHITYGIQKVA